MNIFSDTKYTQAADKCLQFIKNQLNVNNYSLFPHFSDYYADDYVKRVTGHVDMPPDANVKFPNYIYCDQFYDENYVGICSGKHQNTSPATKNLGVIITTYIDQEYNSVICPLHNDGTWKSERYYRTTEYYTIGSELVSEVTYWWRQDVILNENYANNLKNFYLKYYQWIDDEGTIIDVDNLPPTKHIRYRDRTQEEIEAGIYPTLDHTKTYTLKPTLLDDNIIDNASPYYTDYDINLYIYADVEYLALTENIIYDETVTSADLPINPPRLTEEPVPFIKDVIVQPGPNENTLCLAWITNFKDTCTLIFDDQEYSVTPETIAKEHRSCKVTVNATRGRSYNINISGKGATFTSTINVPNNNTYLIAGDPQLITETDAEVWRELQTPQGITPTLIISMGDQVDAIADTVARAKQHTLFPMGQKAPIATVRGNHDKNTHFFSHYNLPNAENGNYWFKHGICLFIAIDTNIINVELHKTFIRKALNATTYTWAILLTHHSLYSTGASVTTQNTTTLREGLTDFIVNQTSIDFVLAGHEHYLCHTHYPGKLFFTAGTITGSKYQEKDILPDLPWSDVNIVSKTQKYTLMEVTNTHIELKSYDKEHNLVDSISISK